MKEAIIRAHRHCFNYTHVSTPSATAAGQANALMTQSASLLIVCMQVTLLRPHHRGHAQAYHWATVKPASVKFLL